MGVLTKERFNKWHYLPIDSINEWIAFSSAIENDRYHKWGQVESRVFADALKLNWIIILESWDNWLKSNKNIWLIIR